MGESSTGQRWEVVSMGERASACLYTCKAVDGFGCGQESTFEVGSKSMGESQYGALDMLGNVSEWVGDWYGFNSPEDVDDPVGPNHGSLRSHRGGSWHDGYPDELRSSRRFANAPWARDVGIGIRCARTPPGP